MNDSDFATAAENTASADRHHRVEIGDCTLYLGDCLEILPTLGRVDAVVTDPPYGTGCAPRGGATAGSMDFSSTPVLPWDVLDCAWVDGLVGDPPIAAFCHPAKTVLVGHKIRADGLLIYLKTNPGPFSSSIESCVTRGFSRKTPQHIEAYNAYNGQVHPTQKPIEVMEFVCRRVRAETILDPFMGSGTTGVACVHLGKKFIGVEREPKYFEIACRRIEKAYAQPDLFVEPPKKIKQEAML